MGRIESGSGQGQQPARMGSLNRSCLHAAGASVLLSQPPHLAPAFARLALRELDRQRHVAAVALGGASGRVRNR